MAWRCLSLWCRTASAIGSSAGQHYVTGNFRCMHSDLGVKCMSLCMHMLLATACSTIAEYEVVIRLFPKGDRVAGCRDQLKIFVALEQRVVDRAVETSSVQQVATKSALTRKLASHAREDCSICVQINASLHRLSRRRAASCPLHSCLQIHQASLEVHMGLATPA